MFQTIRTRVAFALATAFIAGASLAPSASVALAATPDHVYTTPKPDVTVSVYLSETVVDDGQLVTATIKNIGTAASGVIPVKGECSDIDGKHTLAFGQVLAGLPVGNSYHTAQFYCPEGTWGARVTVGTQNDANVKNNIAKTENFW